MILWRNDRPIYQSGIAQSVERQDNLLKVIGAKPITAPNQFQNKYMEKTIRTASGGVAEEFRNLNVGEVISFPMLTYNPNTVRNTPSASMLNERVKTGKKWITSTDMEDKCVYVVRVK